MNNRYLSPRVTADIEKQVKRLLRDLGQPEPPLVLAELYDLLKLDLAYYRSDDDGVLQEVLHKLRVSGKQVLARPALIKEAIAQAGLKALYLHDRKRILIDAAEPTKKLRWREAHEIGHSIIPWHSAYNLGDDVRTLTPTCHEEIESEANYAAGRILFLNERFVTEARALEPSIATVKRLAKAYGNSHNSTLWRLIETSDKILCGLVSVHPRSFPSTSHVPPVRYFIRSQPFARRFSRVKGLEVFNAIDSYCNANSRGPLGTGELLVPDDNDDQNLFVFETFNFTHDTLTLGAYVKPHPVAVGF